MCLNIIWEQTPNYNQIVGYPWHKKFIYPSSVKNATCGLKRTESDNFKLEILKNRSGVIVSYANFIIYLQNHYWKVYWTARLTNLFTNLLLKFHIGNTWPHSKHLFLFNVYCNEIYLKRFSDFQRLRTWILHWYILWLLW